MTGRAWPVRCVLEGCLVTVLDVGLFVVCGNCGNTHVHMRCLYPNRYMYMYMCVHVNTIPLVNAAG